MVKCPKYQHFKLRLSGTGSLKTRGMRNAKIFCEYPPFDQISLYTVSAYCLVL